MRVPLHSKASRTVLVTACIVAALAYCVPACVDVAAAHFAGRSSLRALRAAVWLRPANAEYHYLLGRYLWLVQQDPDGASQAYGAAVQLNPHVGRYWLELAATYQWLGKENAEMAAVNRAVAAEPTTPNVAWDAANYYLIHGDSELSLNEYKIVLTYDPYLYPAAVQAVWRIKPDADYLLQNVMPPIADVYSYFLGLMVNKNETAAAAKVWDRLVQLRQPVLSRNVFTYIAYLVDQKEPEQARLVWQQAGPLCSLSAYEPTTENLIVNGDFDQDVLNGGFDWRYQKRPDIDLSLDATHFQAGRRSLLIDFNSHGTKDAGVWHLISVRPNTSYKFTGYYRADGIEGVGGPRITLQDQYNSENYFTSDYLTDTDFFRPMNAEFSSGPDTSLLVLQLMRDPAGSPIKGKLWLDGFHLVQSPKGKP
jgi:hypothetical protein